jgi:predicted translin family RNA/ssDNA-binding protein
MTKRSKKPRTDRPSQSERRDKTHEIVQAEREIARAALDKVKNRCAPMMDEARKTLWACESEIEKAQKVYNRKILEAYRRAKEETEYVVSDYDYTSDYDDPFGRSNNRY